MYDVYNTSDTDADLAIAAAWVAGTAVQNNPSVQAAFLSAGGLRPLLQILGYINGPSRPLVIEQVKEVHDSSDDEPAQRDTHLLALKLEAKVLYNLASVLRNFAAAQNQLLEMQGLELLWRILITPSATHRNLEHLPPLVAQKFKVREKLLGIVQDLVSDAIVNNVGSSCKDQADLNESQEDEHAGRDPRITQVIDANDIDEKSSRSCPPSANESSNLLVELTSLSSCNGYITLMQELHGMGPENIPLTFVERLAQIIKTIARRPRLCRSWGVDNAKNSINNMKNVLKKIAGKQVREDDSEYAALILQELD